MATSRREFVRLGLAGFAAAVGGSIGGAGVTSAGAFGSTGASWTEAPEAASQPPATQPSTKKKILILGGTGFLGPAIVRYALQQGHELTLFNRGKTRTSLFPDVEKLHGDRDGDLKSLEGGRTWDAVIDTSGYVPRIVQLSADLLKGRVKQYIFISSISVYSNPPVGADENARLEDLPEPKSEEIMKYYGGLKAACEKVVDNVFEAGAVNVRPGLIVGPEDPSDRYTYWPVRMDKGGEVVCPGDGTDPVQYIDVRDLGIWLVKAVEQGLTGAYNAVGPKDKLTIRQMLEACNQAGGNKATLTWVETEFLLAQEIRPWAEMPVWTGGVNGMSTMDSAKAIKTGLTFRDPLETARDTLSWWKSLPEARRSKLQGGLKAEKEEAVLKSWKEQRK